MELITLPLYMQLCYTHTHMILLSLGSRFLYIVNCKHRGFDPLLGRRHGKDEQDSLSASCEA